MAYTTIDKPSDYFNTVLYSGSASSLSVTGVGFQPDLIWIKRRNAVANHKVNDSVRGTGLALSISTNAEISQTGIASFDSDGFTLGTGSADHNTSGGTYASWNWLAGGTAVTNNDGATASSVSANPTAGFSVITHTGTGSATNFGHGLNQTPEFVITKSRTLSGGNWDTWHKSFNATQIIRLQSTAARTTSSTSYGTVPDSSVIYVGTSNHTNQSGQSILHYAFHSVKGYSKIGSYTGNGNANGTFVYTGFKPAWILLKRIDSADSWTIRDNKRDVDNVVTQLLYPDLTSSEATAASNNYLDIVSNGFKLRATSGQVNGSGGSYLYMAFAENPFVTGASGIPCTAR